MVKPKAGMVLQSFQGMTVGTLVRVLARNHCKVSPRYFHRLAYLFAVGMMNSFFSRVEALDNGRNIETSEIVASPIFIIGHWRSGTTHLHNLLSHDQNFACPTVYQTMFPHHFLYTQRKGGRIFDLLCPPTRPMDNIAFSAAAQHEDEFALAALSTVSPYMRFLFPLTGDGVYSSLDPLALPQEALDAWKNSFIHLLKKLTFWKGKRVVLKSPPHTGRIRILLEMFPDAKFIHIVRDPYVVYMSTRKLWLNSLNYSHLQTPDPEAMDEMILSWYTELFELYERDRPLIPKGSLHELRLEDLEASPREALKGIYRTLGLEGFESFLGRVEPYLKSIENYQKNGYTIDSAAREKVRLRWRQTFDKYGYSLESGLTLNSGTLPA